ncbi:hypothetical protein [Rhizobium halophytocola]|uniref:Purine-cytosine permease-like protein n=1 Tax=Rhizobium halophytocola TaxID=735519 RepID=A0ABS4DTI3_9HYPH|nr:hypothetical protein [Rhizobium halophytocola]MBP1848990.1 purine-cytosine permease-like protein [Rhizobium halophytocola]
MSDPANNDRSSAIAAAVILLVVGAGIYFLPNLTLWIGQYSPVLAATVGAVVILSFFLIFWVRTIYKRRRDNSR